MKPRAILVSVNYGDLLGLTLPFNRHHFEEVMVVTTPEDKVTQDVAIANGADLHATNAFYDDGADFNKWKALEEGLTVFGRHGWLCLMDADIVFPPELPRVEYLCGRLYSPYRHVIHSFDTATIDLTEVYNSRHLFPIYQEREWAGYTQIFHADDPVLPCPPWHEQNWRHAGGADSAFQNLWSKYDKIRLPWNVLHLGDPGYNWCGRNHEDRKKLFRYLRTRAENRNYEAEKLPPKEVE